MIGFITKDLTPQKLPKIGICGMGTVGTALYNTFVYHADVVRFDINGIGKVEDLADCDMTYICVPTPKDDLTALMWAFDNVKCPLLVIKSTVVPGTCRVGMLGDSRKIVVNPEFFNDRSADEEFANSSRIILGGHPRDTAKVRKFYELIFPQATYFEVSLEEAELLKCITNAAMAVKISMANEFKKIADFMGADWNKIQKMLESDERLGNVGWQVPGPDGQPGFGGRCLPNDLERLIQFSNAWGEDPLMLKAARAVNHIIRPQPSQNQ